MAAAIAAMLDTTFAAAEAGGELDWTRSFDTPLFLRRCPEDGCLSPKPKPPENLLRRAAMMRIEQKGSEFPFVREY